MTARGTIRKRTSRSRSGLSGSLRRARQARYFFQPREFFNEIVTFFLLCFFCVQFIMKKMCYVNMPDA